MAYQRLDRRLGIVTPDELADARVPGATGPSLVMTAEVTDAAGRSHPVSRGTWADAHFGFGDMLARASADARLRPGDLIGSITGFVAFLMATEAVEEGQGFA